MRGLAVLFSPLVPFSSEKIWTILNIASPIEKEEWNRAGELTLTEGHQLQTPEILFTKIEDSVIENELHTLGHGSELQAKPEETPSKNYAPLKPQIQYEDFQKVDLRVAKIISAEAVPKSKKLLKLHVDLGFEQRQIVAGIAEKISPEQLIGKTIIVVANLAPAKLMGVESNGMLLATVADGENFALLTSSKEVEQGIGIK